MLSIFSKLRGKKTQMNRSQRKSGSPLKVELLEDRSVPATFWVSPNGSNSNPGTQDQPFQTIAFALSVTGQDPAADTINIFPGTYSESMANQPANPTQPGNTDTLNYGLYVAPNNPVTLQGVDANGATINSSANVQATIRAGINLNVPNESKYNVSNFAIYAPNSVLNGLKFEAAAVTNSTAPGYDLITIYGNNITVSNSVINSGVVDPNLDEQPLGTNGSGITVADPSFTSSTLVSSITSFNIDSNVISGGVLITRGAGFGVADASSLKITRNTLSTGYYGNVAVYGNLGDPVGNPYYIYDAAIPAVGGPGLQNTFIGSPNNPAFRQFVYFYGNSALAMTKAQLDFAVSGNNLVGNYSYAVDSTGIPQATGNSATGGNPGDNNFFGFSIYNSVSELGDIVTVNPSNAAANWPVRAGNTVNYQVSQSGSANVTLSDLIFNPQGTSSADYKLVMGTTPGVGDVRALTLTGALAASVDGNGAGNTINGNTGPNTIRGFAGNDFLNGNAGNDNLAGGTGNDNINGGTGIDTAIFDGNLNNFRITYNSSTRTFSVQDIRQAGPEGNDAVTNVEFFQFNDTLVTVVTPGSAFNTVGLGLSATAPGNIIFIGSGSYNESVNINQNVTLIGFGQVLIATATIGGNARLGSSTVNVQVQTVNLSQVGGTNSRPTDAVLISINALGYGTASTINFFGDPNSGTDQGKAGNFTTGINLYRRVLLVGTASGASRTQIGNTTVPSGNIRYTSLIAGQPAPQNIIFRNGINLSSTRPTAPVPPTNGIYQLPNYN